MSFQLRVEFTGLCLFAIDGATESVGVLLPDFQLRAGRSMRFGKEPANRDAHRAYLRFDAASMGLPVAGGEGIDGATYQVVRLLDGKRLTLLTGLTGPVSSEPIVPSLDAADPATTPVTLDPTWFSTTPANLAARLILRGGQFEQARTGASWQFPDTLTKVFRNQTDNFQGVVRWTADLDSDGMAVVLCDFDGKKLETLVLRPVPQPDGSSAVVLRLANLCRINPMQWSGYEPDLVTQDVDFRWFFEVVQTPGGWDAALAAAGDLVLPCPVISSLVPHGDRNCTGTRLHVSGIVRE